MSGIGKRFIDAGYKVPKPLIEVEGKPIIHHIIDLFPGDHTFDFICNDYHVESTNMREILLSKVPGAQIHTVSVKNRKGPVDAILQIAEKIADDDEIIVSYCDYGTKWNYEAFSNEVHKTQADGAIACYIGFHPHMLGSDNYAFLRHEDKWAIDIQEKKAFTENKMAEYASNGTYYFRNGSLLKHYFQKLVDKDMSINGEYYVSLAYKLMIEDNLKIRIFEIEKMLQWGTPRDLEEYLHWSTYFHKRKNHPLTFRDKESYTLILPMAGAGSRFRMVGYDTPKPLLPVQEEPMVVQAVKCLPPSQRSIFICLNDHLQSYPLEKTISAAFQNSQVFGINEVTEGQACTCEIGITKGNIDNETPLLISACDNGAYYDVEKFYRMLDDTSIDVIVFSFTNNPTSQLYPHMYAWLKVNEEGTILDVSIKKTFPDYNATHCIIGTMYFRKTSLFLKGLQSIYETNFRTNGEFYVDNLLIPLIQQGYKVKVFEVEHYLCWGTPNDYKTYLYWDDYFQYLKTKE